MDDGGSGSSNGSSVIVTAQYESTRDGKKKFVSLIDAVTPLLGPPTHQLLLSSRPIDVPWPLAVGDVADNLFDKDRRTKRQRIDDVGLQIEQLQDVLAIEVPEALRQLQACLLDRKEDWLTLSSAKGVLIFRANAAKGGIDIPCVELELKEESRRALDSIDEEAEKMLPVDTGANCESGHLIHRLFANDGNCDATIDIQVKDDKATKVCMPPRSAFLLTNILRSQMDLPRGWQQLLTFADDHPPSLILLDPPYPNYSAKRLKTKQETYEPVEDLYDLWKLKLPVQKLLDRRNKKEGVLVGCWVTNNAISYREVICMNRLLILQITIRSSTLVIDAVCTTICILPEMFQSIAVDCAYGC
jgi:hypothetical protein